jgi:hypothetical protein
VRTALAARRAREAQGAEEIAILGAAFEGHVFYLRERSTPRRPAVVTCHECDRRLERPYAVWAGQPSFARCLDDIDALPTQSREPRSGDDEPPELVMRSFAGVIVCDDM